MTQAVLDDIPLPISIFRPDGVLIGANRTSIEFWGLPHEEVIGHFNALNTSQGDERHLDQIFARVMQGERIEAPPAQYDIAQMSITPVTESRILWTATTFTPLRDQQGTISYILAIVNDMTAVMEQANEIEASHQEILQQRETIRVLATPVIQVWDGILTVPILGVLNAHRANQMTETLLEAIVHTQAERVILDVTGAEEIDTQAAHYLLTTASACRLLGSHVALVGIAADAAQSMVQLGVDLSSIVVRANLQAGIAWAFEQQGLTIQSHATNGRKV